jgi:hypothetical protein
LAGTVDMAISNSTSPRFSGLTLNLDAEALAKVREFVQVPADSVRIALRSFVLTATQTEPAWGTGEIGRQLEGQYRPGFNDLVKLLGDLVEGFQSVGGSFTVAASNVMVTEEANQT